MPYGIATFPRALAGVFVFAVTITTAFAQSTPGSSLTFHNQETWEIPGAVLKPDTYTITVKDSMFDREILTVTDASNKVRSTFIATSPIVSSAGSAEGQFSFWPTKPGKNRIVRAWIGAGGSSVRQFTYPKAKAVEIANASRESVPAIDPASDTRLHHGGNNDEDRKIIQLWLLTATEVTPGKPAIEARKLESSDIQMASTRPTAAPDTQSGSGAASVATAEVPPIRTRRVRAAAAPREETPAMADSAATSHKMPDTASNIPETLFAGTMCIAGALLLMVFKRRLS